MIYAMSDVDGLRTHIIDADKNSNYSCVICGDRVIPHKGVGKPLHYNHATNSNCTIGARKSKGCYISTIYNTRRCKASLECDKECDLK